MNTVTIPLNTLVELLRKLDSRAKIYIFEHVFIESDTAPLTAKERISLENGLKDYRDGEVIEWRAGK